MDGRRPYRNHARWLWALLGLFLVRVTAQPLAALTGWPWLPPFVAWQSGALPYPALLASQIVLVVAMARAAEGVSRGRTRPRSRVGWALAAAAAVYFAAMLVRLVLGLTVARGHWWLDAPLPTAFHLGLASYLGAYAHFHVRAAADGGGIVR